MAVYVLEPEVAGGVGEGSVVDWSVNPPRVTHLEYEFAGWLGDDIVESFPCYVVTTQLGTALKGAGLSGFQLDDVVVTTTSEFPEHHPEPLPEFAWLRVVGSRGADDLWIGDDRRLTVNDRGMAVFRQFSIGQCLVAEVD